MLARAEDLTKEGMLQGIQDSAAFLLFLSEGVLQRPYCQLEIRQALALNKPVVLCHESDPRFGSFDFSTAHSQAPPDLQQLLDQHESLVSFLLSFLALAFVAQRASNVLCSPSVGEGTSGM